jgi:hypothetical protein
LIHKTKTEESKREVQQLQTGLTGEENRSDRCATTQSRIFEAEDTRLDRMACVEAKQGAIARHPSNGENLKTSKTALEGFVSLVIKGSLVIRASPYILFEGWMAANSWNSSHLLLLFSLPNFLGFP